MDITDLTKCLEDAKMGGGESCSEDKKVIQKQTEIRNVGREIVRCDSDWRKGTQNLWGTLIWNRYSPGKSNLESSCMVRNLGRTVKANRVSDACTVTNTGHSGLKVTVRESMDMEGGCNSVVLSVWSHAPSVLPGCALRSLWLEGKVIGDALRWRQGFWQINLLSLQGSWSPWASSSGSNQFFSFSLSLLPQCAFKYYHGLCVP